MDALEALKEVLELERNEGESAVEFSARVYENIKAAPEDDWNKLGDLSEDVQSWYNKYHQHATGDIKGRMPVYPGVPGRGNGAVKEKKPPKERVPGSGYNTRIKELTMADPKMSSQDIMDLMQSEGAKIEKISTVSTTRGAFIGAIRFLKTKGYLKDLEGF